MNFRWGNKPREVNERPCVCSLWETKACQRPRPLLNLDVFARCAPRLAYLASYETPLPRALGQASRETQLAGCRISIHSLISALFLSLVTRLPRARERGARWRAGKERPQLGPKAWWDYVSKAAAAGKRMVTGSFHPSSKPRGLVLCQSPRSDETNSLSFCCVESLTALQDRSPPCPFYRRD